MVVDDYIIAITGKIIALLDVIYQYCHLYIYYSGPNERLVYAMRSSGPLSQVLLDNFNTVIFPLKLRFK
jgi:hypothetical protein